jgi:type II secretory pathway pseudopilin PulG
MSATTSKSPSAAANSTGAFTLIEILVVVGIIIVLAALLVPALYHAKLSAKIASTRSTLSSIRTGLTAYYSDFQAYPDSHSATPTGTYGPTPPSIIPFGRGPALLAQALMGYLPGSLDGAGPDSGPNTAAYAADPKLGFRIRGLVTLNGTPTAMGTIKGPYGPDDPAVFKVNDTNALTDPTQPHDQSFYDSFGNEILYFRAQPAPAGGPPASVIFNTSTLIGPATVPLFYADDCSVHAPTTPPPPNPVAPTVGAVTGFDPFFALIAGAKNSGAANLITSYPGPIMGHDSFLLISAGPNGNPALPTGGYFDSDDIVMDSH